MYFHFIISTVFETQYSWRKGCFLETVKKSLPLSKLLNFIFVVRSFLLSLCLYLFCRQMNRNEIIFFLLIKEIYFNRIINTNGKSLSLLSHKIKTTLVSKYLDLLIFNFATKTISKYKSI